MINFEKYKDEIIKITHDSGFSHPALKENSLASCCDVDCESCKFYYGDGETCIDKWFQWAYEEYVEPEVDWSKVPIDTKILVRDSEEEQWSKRYFSRVDGKGGVFAFDLGNTSWSAEGCDTWWKYAKLAED